MSFDCHLLNHQIHLHLHHFHQKYLYHHLHHQHHQHHHHHQCNQFTIASVVISQSKSSTTIIKSKILEDLKLFRPRPLFSVSLVSNQGIRYVEYVTEGRLKWAFLSVCSLASPRAKGLRAESTRAVTGRRCPHSGEGEDFLTSQLNFVYENCCNSGTESRKIDPKVGN